MKSSLFWVFIAVVLLLQGRIAAQSLAFSQVKTISQAETVPANKVWKLNGCFYNALLSGIVSSGSGSGTYSNSDAYILVNNQSVAVRSSRSGGGYYHAAGFVWEMAWPMWLQAGTTLAASTGVLSISVIEFTIVP
jgi:hypothetical protein